MNIASISQIIMNQFIEKGFTGIQNYYFLSTVNKSSSVARVVLKGPADSSNPPRFEFSYSKID